MEKYSKFRDESTGIAPFLAPKKISSKFNIILRLLLIVYSAITTPISLLGLALYFLVLENNIPAAITGLITRWFMIIPLRIFNVNEEYEGQNKASVRQAKMRKPQPGDVLLSNFVSPLDPFVYNTIRKSVFVFPTADGNFEQLSVLKVMQRALGEPYIANTGTSLSTICSSAKRSKAIVVVFVEGTTTNGKGVLTVKNLNCTHIGNVESSVYASAIKYTPMTIPNVTPKSIIKYIWDISTSTWWYLATVKCTGKPIEKSELSNDEVARDIARVGRLRILGDNLDLEAKRQYIASVRK